MKNRSLFCILLFILTSACSTTNSYIRQNQALFDSYSLSDQRLIKSGQIAVGFTEMQVRMAIGAPSRIVPDTRPNSTRYIWEYVDIQASQGAIRKLDSLGTSMVSGTNPNINLRGNPLNEKLRRRVVFEREDQKVIQYQFFR